MPEVLVSMSKAERERAFVVRQCVAGDLSQREASERLGIGIRQVKRLVRNWRREREAGPVSRRRGGPFHRRMSEARRSRIGELIQIGGSLHSGHSSGHDRGATLSRR